MADSSILPKPINGILYFLQKEEQFDRWSFYNLNKLVNE